MGTFVFIWWFAIQKIRVVSILRKKRKPFAVYEEQTMGVCGMHMQPPAYKINYRSSMSMLCRKYLKPQLYSYRSTVQILNEKTPVTVIKCTIHVCIKYQLIYT